ncbi:MAG: hypothetical protein LBB59_02720 [Campylobacteraceae bacterium]|jgi:hypothetical protein|nr:hypothetical protein [Campylobacteraceae bacterium]
MKETKTRILMRKLKVTHAELAKELGIVKGTVDTYRTSMPKKLDLMIDGLRYRKLVRFLFEEELKISLKNNKIK